MSSAPPPIALPECDVEPEPFQGKGYDDIMRIRKSKLNPGLVTFYREPLYVTRGHMQWLWNEKNERFLDLFGGIVTVSVGHCHPKVNEAVKEQVDTLWHTTSIYLHPKIHEYAERLVETLPGNLSCVYLVNSGSEANDLAVQMARLYTGNYDVVSLRNSYHGMSHVTMGLSAHSNWKYQTPMGYGVTHAMNPDPYIGLFGGKHCRDSPVQVQGRDCDCAADGACKATTDYMTQFDEVVKYSLPKGKSMAAFFAESIQGVGGSVQFPKGYLKAAFERTRELGGVCVSDEVQTGFGRTGTHFWGFEGHGVQPDIVTMAKGMGNGFPIAAVVTTPEVGEVVTRALHFNTFGGNPLSCAAGIAVLDAIKEDKLQENSHQIGTYFLNELAKLRDEYEIVGDVRGKGLMIGIEMVEDKGSKKPLNGGVMADIWEKCKQMRLLLGKGGLNGNIFRIKPPMCITKQDADFAITVMRAAIDDVVKK